MDNDTDISRFLRSAATAMGADEILRAPPRTLMGVSAAAEAALQAINISSIFDLAVSRVFAAASALVAIQRDPTAIESRLNIVASDVAQPPPGMPVDELANQPISILRPIGDATTLAQALDVATVRDLALWPPYRAAKAILNNDFFPEQTAGFDPEAPADLLPKSGVYPTERVFFKKLLIDAMPTPGPGAQPIEQAGPINLAGAFAAPAGFGGLATGALLTFSQSWFSQGLTLGALLHSTSLAPGESTRLAMIDWSRRSRAAASEDISELELLSNTMTHSRAISEVTNATATEFQTGRSSTSAQSTTEQGGIGGGLEIGPLAIGGSAASSTTTTDVMTASSSFGARQIAANYAQQINDRSQQNAASVRNRRASVVREVSQSEHEQISTRVVTNYNHMHALSVHYYEVVQAFRTTTQLERAERCLFVPVQLVDFSDAALVNRWRLVLATAALTERTRRQLTVEYGVVEIIPQTPRIRPGGVIVGGVIGTAGGLATAAFMRVATARFTASMASSGGAGTGGSSNAGAASGGSAGGTSSGDTTMGDATDGGASGSGTSGTTKATSTDYLRAPLNSPVALLALKGWDIDQLNRVGWATGRILMQAGSDSVFVSDDALLIGFSLREGQSGRFVVRLHTGQEVVPAAVTDMTCTFSAPIAITELESIAVQYTGTQDLHTALVLQLNLFGTVMPLDVPIVLRPMSVPWEAVKFGAVAPQRELMDHLNANRLHYTQAILRSLDAATVAGLIARYTYCGLPLGQVVDPQPVAVMANFLVFKMNVESGGEPDHARWAAEQKDWETWLARRGLDHPAPRSEIIPLPSGGVFAEAVLGRYNAAEKMDLQRFWNWQDSPIPITPPDIAPVQAGSRAQAENLLPGQLGAPVLGIQAPTALPDAAGVAAIITAVQNGNMFRDMSGLAQTAAIAQAAMQASAAGATAVGAQAGQNLKTVMDNNTERLRIAAQLATGGAAGLGGGGGSGSRPAKNMTEEGARLNYARDMDQRLSSGSAKGASSSPGGGRRGVVDVPSPEIQRSAEIAQPSIERDLFDLQTGGTTANLAKQVAPVRDEIPLAVGKRIDTEVAVDARISQLISDSGLVQFAWRERGRAPIGYLEGIARTYARVYCNFKKDPIDQFADAMARGVAPGAPQLDGNGNFLDAVKKFKPNFDAFEVDVEVDGIDVLRAVFTILFSLGMFESGGKHCAGWDRGKLDGWGDPTKAVVPTATNSEAGLFQISFDIGVGVPGDFQDLYERYKQRPLSGFLVNFRHGVTCQVPGTDGGAIFGTGDGKDFQEFSKECPAFTAELAALAIRVRANHFGPINKNKIEIVQSCWDLLQEIESAIDELNGCIAVAM